MTTTALRRLTGLCHICFCFILLPGQGDAEDFFTRVGPEKIISPSFNGRGFAFGDYDNDGWPDLFLAKGFLLGGMRLGDRLAFLHNQEGERFEYRTANIQADIPSVDMGGGSIFGDYDNDGDLDLYVPIGFWGARVMNMLLRNDRGIFRDVALDAGLTDTQITDNAIWLDYNRDGFVDIYAGNLMLSNQRNILYQNNGDGTFTDVTEKVGLEVVFSEESGGSNGGMAAGDFNGDGWPDLYVGVFRDRNRLFLSDGKGGFNESTSGDVSNPGDAFGVAAGDIDNDGDLDIFQAAGGGSQLERSILLLNLGEGQFLDVAEAVGLSPLSAEITLGAIFADIENDGDLDLVTASPHFLFLNDGGGLFEDQTVQSGIAGDDYANLAVSDYNLDGFLDVYVSRIGNDITGLYHNNGNTNHWLRVELVGVESNRSGIGARVVATSDDLSQMREISGGYGFKQNEMVAHFGLGERTQVDQLEIRWPSGQVDVLTDIPVDQKIRIIEGQGKYHAVRPTVWEYFDLPDSLVIGETVDLQAIVRPALFESDAEIIHVMADLSELGGPSELPLANQGDGTYALELSFPVEGVSGYSAISVMIDQRTSLGSHWTNLSKTIAVLPDRDQVVFAEGWGANWQAGKILIAEVDFGGQTVVYEGQTAMEVSAGGLTIECLPVEPVNLVGYDTLRFAFHPGEVTAGFRPAFLVMINNDNNYRVKLLGGDLEGIGVDLERKEWQVVEIPLEAFGSFGQVLKSISFTGNLRGTFYLDDIRLVAAEPPASITAVLEQHSSRLPQSFSLDQNYPNPFNSDTVIHFALPEGTDVELAVYNLAGQQVMTLVQGAREAGTYSVRWDGRNDGGRTLASGVYLYRLRTDNGQQVEARKFLLLK
jgi:enediyne biosynthesis protein E4